MRPVNAAALRPPAGAGVPGGQPSRVVERAAGGPEAGVQEPPGELPGRDGRRPGRRRGRARPGRPPPAWRPAGSTDGAPRTGGRASTRRSRASAGGISNPIVPPLRNLAFRTWFSPPAGEFDGPGRYGVRPLAQGGGKGGQVSPPAAVRPGHGQSRRYPLSAASRVRVRAWPAASSGGPGRGRGRSRTRRRAWPRPSGRGPPPGVRSVRDVRNETLPMSVPRGTPESAGGGIGSIIVGRSLARRGPARSRCITVMPCRSASATVAASSRKIVRPASTARTAAPAFASWSSIVVSPDGRHVEPHVLLRLRDLHHHEPSSARTSSPARSDGLVRPLHRLDGDDRLSRGP